MLGVHVIVGSGVKCMFWKATSSQCVFEYFDYSMERRFYVCMLGLAMEFNVAYLMVFKILVDALDFAMDSAYACEFECM